MSDYHRANRRFEMAFPGIAEQERLRSTDPERYRQYMDSMRRQAEQRNSQEPEGELVATIIYNSRTGEIRYERPGEPEKKEDK